MPLPICIAFSWFFVIARLWSNRLNGRYRRLVAASPFELSLDVVHSPVQPFDGSGDLSNVIAGDCRILLGRRYERGPGFSSHVWTVWQSIPLVTQAQVIAELEVGAAPIRVSPKRWGFLRNARGNAEEEGGKDYGSHHYSMNRNVERVEPPKKG